MKIAIVAVLVCAFLSGCTADIAVNGKSRAQLQQCWKANMTAHVEENILANWMIVWCSPRADKE